MTEHGYVVRPLSIGKIAEAAEDFLRRCSPEHLISARALDVVSLVDHKLQDQDILVYPVEVEELPDSEAETRSTEGRWIEILMREEFYAALFRADPNTNRARSTLAHEIGHAVLHKKYLQDGRRQPEAMARRRAPRGAIKAYRDSEWQAHTFAGALLVPRSALHLVDSRDALELAHRFQVSEPFVRSHLKRIQKAL